MTTNNKWVFQTDHQSAVVHVQKPSDVSTQSAVVQVQNLFLFLSRPDLPNSAGCFPWSVDCQARPALGSLPVPCAMPSLCAEHATTRSPVLCYVAWCLWQALRMPGFVLAILWPALKKTTTGLFFDHPRPGNPKARLWCAGGCDSRMLCVVWGMLHDHKESGIVAAA